MSEPIYVVLSNPVRGQEQAFEDWYAGRHLADVVAVEGFTSARLYKLAEPGAEGAPPQRYMAIYNMDTDDPAGLVDELRVLVETGKMAMSEAFSEELLATHRYTPITPMVAKQP